MPSTFSLIVRYLVLFAVLVYLGDKEIRAIARMKDGGRRAIVPTTRREIAANEQIRSDDLRWELRKIAVNADFASDAKDVENRYAARDLARGEVLTEDLIRDRPGFSLPDSSPRVTIVAIEPKLMQPRDLVPGDRVDLWTMADAQKPAEMLVREVSVPASAVGKAPGAAPRVYLALSEDETKKVDGSIKGVVIHRVAGARYVEPGLESKKVNSKVSAPRRAR